MLIPVSRRQLQIIAQYKQPIQTNQIVFSNGGDELILTTGDGQVKILDYPSMVMLLPDISQLSEILHASSSSIVSSRHVTDLSSI